MSRNLSINNKMIIRQNSLFSSLVEKQDVDVADSVLPKRYAKFKKGIVFLKEYGIYTFADKGSIKLASQATYGTDDPTANEWSSNRILINEHSVKKSLLYAMMCLESLSDVLCKEGKPFRIVICYNPPEPDSVFDGVDCTISFYMIRPDSPDIFGRDIEEFPSALLFCDINT